MKVGDDTITKFQYATALAGALTYMLLKQGDAVGLLTFSDREVEYMRPRRRSVQLSNLLSLLANSEPKRETDIASGLSGVVERINRRGMLVLISDFFADIDDIIDHLNRMRYRNHEVIAFQLLTPDERDFPFSDLVEFIDAENDERITTQTSYIADSYKSALGAHQDALRAACRDNNIDLIELTTADKLDAALLAFLSKRQLIK